MTRVFLSYSKEDSEIALRVGNALESRGATVYRFEAPEHTGGRFMRTIPTEIEQADLFVALVSPTAIRSRFCAFEHEIAVHRELTLGEDFVYVFEVATAPKKGLLAPYTWLDLTAHVTESKLADAVATLPLGTERRSGAAEPSRFQNRTEELDRVLDELTTTGGRDHWLVVSPPKMGKTWFLDEVRRRFVAKKAGRAKPVNLREQELDVRYDAIRLLCLLLDVDVPDETLDDDARLEKIAVAVALRSTHHLALLDNAELMDRATTTRFRQGLRRIQELIRQSPYASRLSIVVGSRRTEGWSGAGTGTGDRLRLLLLTGFEQPVVQQVLQGTGLAFQQPALDNWTAGLYELSRGLPALLASSVAWATDQGFINPAACAKGPTFDQVVAPYIKRELLSIHSLLPEAGEKLVERHSALVAALQALAPYRIVTASHLKHHLDRNAAFAGTLTNAGWSRHELWNAIAGTALLLERDNEIWLSHYPPIRQLLYEHFYRSTEDQRATHLAARAFYERWAEAAAGTEQPRMLVESLWHEACMLCCSGSPDLPDRLLAVAVELTRRFIRPTVYEPVDLEGGVRRQLNNDDEFARLVSRYDGLFDEVVNRISATIVGGA